MGLGVQGAKRAAVAKGDVVATVDPLVASADYRNIEQVPVDYFDAVLVCTPDQQKLGIISYVLSLGKHVLVEKPLLAQDEESLLELRNKAEANGVTCYSAYNHRFEPHLVRLKQILDEPTLGKIHLAKLFYGNGTAFDVKQSTWRDQGLGVLHDLGSHLVDLVLFFFGRTENTFEVWGANRFETRAYDHVLFGSSGAPFIELEATFLSWKNTFSVDVVGDLGSAHVNGLCKWGPSTLTVRRRTFPSGVPVEETQTIECSDPTWALEYAHFQQLCCTGGNNVDNDLWINAVFNQIDRVGEEVPVP